MGLFVMETCASRTVPHHCQHERAHAAPRVLGRVVFLFIFAGIEAGLALMRDMLSADKQALVQSLASGRKRPRPIPCSGSSRRRRRWFSVSFCPSPWHSCDPARILHLFAAHGRWSGPGDAGACVGVPAAHPRQPNAAVVQSAGHAVRRHHRAATGHRAPGEGGPLGQQ